jgi:hypothetical protein
MPPMMVHVPCRTRYTSRLIPGGSKYTTLLVVQIEHKFFTQLYVSTCIATVFSRNILPVCLTSEVRKLDSEPRRKASR